MVSATAEGLGIVCIGFVPQIACAATSAAAAAHVGNLRVADVRGSACLNARRNITLAAQYCPFPSCQLLPRYHLLSNTHSRRCLRFLSLPIQRHRFPFKPHSQRRCDTHPAPDQRFPYSNSTSMIQRALYSDTTMLGTAPRSSGSRTGRTEQPRTAKWTLDTPRCSSGFTKRAQYRPAARRSTCSP